MGETNNKCFTGIVAYGLTGSTDAVAQAFVDENNKLNPLDRCDVLLVVDAFVCIWNDEQGRMVFPENGHHLGVGNFGRKSLLMFYLYLMHRLADFQPPTLDLMAYAHAGGALTGLQWRGIEA